MLNLLICSLFEEDFYLKEQRLGFALFGFDVLLMLLEIV